MPAIDTGILTFGTMDDMARGDTRIHRLDPRIKLLVTLCFVVTVVSMPKYEVAMLIPFAAFPLFTVQMADIPVRFIAKRVLLAMPFALAIGIFNPVFDRHPVLSLANVTISGGWLSFLTIQIKSVLTISSVLVLLACTGIQRIGTALEYARVPGVFTVQILFLYRYLHVLGEEAARMARAALIRSGHPDRISLTTYGHLIGCLLLRTLNRAERIHLAMRCRGFEGNIPTGSRVRMKPADAAFAVGWIAFFLVFRLHNMAQSLGAVVLELVR